MGWERRRVWVVRKECLMVRIVGGVAISYVHGRCWEG
jgi:hypothetical protein